MAKPKRGVKNEFSYKPLRIIAIIWRDAASEPLGHLDDDDLHGLIEQHSTGWYLGEDDEKVSISMDYCPESRQWRHVMHIPHANIVRRRFFKFTP